MDVSANHGLRYLYHVQADCVAGISKEHATSFIRAEVRSTGSTLTMTHNESLKSVII
jgi:hypothetical protein